MATFILIKNTLKTIIAVLWMFSEHFLLLWSSQCYTLNYKKNARNTKFLMRMYI